MNKSVKSWILVALQLLIVCWLLYSTPVDNITELSLSLCLLAVLLAIWSIAVMRKSKLRIEPLPSPNAILISNGPYRIIRHPMYTAILVGCTGLLIAHFTWLRLAFTIVLAVVLLFKLQWEEKLLVAKLPAYLDYMQQTKRLIPLLY